MTGAMERAADAVVGKFSAGALARDDGWQLALACVTLEVAQNPVALGAPFEFASLGLGSLGAGKHRQELFLRIAEAVGRREGRDQLTLQHEVRIAANRRAELRIVVEADSRVIFGKERQTRLLSGEIAAAQRLG